MSFLVKSNTLTSLLCIDGKNPYNSLRPHHLLVLYTTFAYVKSTKLYKAVTSYFLNALSRTTDLALPLVYSGLIPDFLIRYAIQIRCREHLQLLKCEGSEADHITKMEIVQELKLMPVAINTDEANDQHYEVSVS